MAVLFSVVHLVIIVSLLMLLHLAPGLLSAVLTRFSLLFALPAHFPLSLEHTALLPLLLLSHDLLLSPVMTGCVRQDPPEADVRLPF